MNILQINSNDIIGGATRLAFDLHNNLTKKQVNNKMLVGYKYSSDSDIYPIYKQNFTTKSYKFIINNLNKYLSHQFKFYPIKKITHDKLVKEADIVHLHNLHGSYFNLNILSLLSQQNKKLVWTLHDMWAVTGHCAHAHDCTGYTKACGNCPYLNEYPELIKDKTAKLLAEKKYIYKNSNISLVVPSMWLKNIISKSILKDKNIKLIYNGVDTNIFKPGNKRKIREKLNLPPDSKIIIFIAYLGLKNLKKGGKYLQKIINTIEKDGKITLLNIGGKENNTSEHNNIINIPFISDRNLLADYYRASDIFVFPTLAENCPLTILESMACGTPVVSFDVGGVPELISHNEDGYVAKYKDGDDLYNGVKKLLENKELLSNMSRKSSEKIKLKFNLDKMTNEYIELYKELAK